VKNDIYFRTDATGKSRGDSFLMSRSHAQTFKAYWGNFEKLQTMLFVHQDLMATLPRAVHNSSSFEKITFYWDS
jgi:hypothetical protein